MPSTSPTESQRIANSIQIPTITPQELAGTQDTPILDVRSPGEFSRGQIPRAQNTPLFSDQERSEIGTLYKQLSVDAAVERGMSIANLKTDGLLSLVRQHVQPGRNFVMHCWRGGMRSEGFARLCIDNGFTPRLLVGGYKAYRQFVASSFLRPMPLVVVTGSTGCGKTELLKQLQAVGEQVIDLESLAGHKGSAFGGICQPLQPTVEQFENLLFDACRAFRMDKPIWVEDESRSIGHIGLPEAFWQQLSNAPAVIVASDTKDRVDRLVREYGHLPRDELVAAISRLRKRLGGQRFQTATALVEAGQIAAAISIILEYYDKAYAKALAARPGTWVDSLHRLGSRQRPLDRAALQELQDLGARLVETSYSKHI